MVGWGLLKGRALFFTKWRRPEGSCVELQKMGEREGGGGRNKKSPGWEESVWKTPKRPEKWHTCHICPLNPEKGRHLLEERRYSIKGGRGKMPEMSPPPPPPPPPPWHRTFCSECTQLLVRGHFINQELLAMAVWVHSEQNVLCQWTGLCPSPSQCKRVWLYETNEKKGTKKL